MKRAWHMTNKTPPSYQRRPCNGCGRSLKGRKSRDDGLCGVCKAPWSNRR